MLQNIKIDIIYYKSDTDFEMEFNLGGCCRMRLLTGKSFDEKTTVHCLARAVSRSKVIMVVGPLFGKKGIINIISTAIGSKTETINKAAYKITCAEEIEIIKNSTPLITPEGFFGGCIIENGPQTMILLSDSKNIRKPIMKNLIHPYIEKLYTSEYTSNYLTELNDEMSTTQSDSLHSAENTETAKNSDMDAAEAFEAFDSLEKSFPESHELIEEPAPTIPELTNISVPESHELIEDIVPEVPVRKSRFKHAEIEPEPELEAPTETNLQPESEPQPEIETKPEPVLDSEPILDFEIKNEDKKAEIKKEIIEEPDFNKVESNYVTFEIDENIDEDESDFLFQSNEKEIEEDTGFNVDNGEEIDAAQDIGLYVEPDKLTRRRAKMLNKYYASLSDNEQINTEIDERYNYKKRISLNPPILVLAILLLVVVTLLCYCIFYVPTRYGVSTMQYINEIFSTLFR